MYRDTSSVVAGGHYVATAVSLPPQFTVLTLSKYAAVFFTKY
jgi:hypothetical protein